MKNLQNLKGAKTLTKKEQRNVVGGRLIICDDLNQCREPLACDYSNGLWGYCVPVQV